MSPHLNALICQEGRLASGRAKVAAKEREEDEVFVWPQVRCEGHTGLSTLISE